MVGTAIAIPVSVILLLFFGEIIPQSIFINNAIPVCAFFSYIMYFFMIITAPVSLLISLLLDKLVGHREALFYRRRELREFITLQAQPYLDRQPEWTDSDTDSFEDIGGVLDKREIKLMMGALSLSETYICNAMKTRISETICVSMDAKVTKDLVDRVFLCGMSRIPVYTTTPEFCTHYLLSKTLVLQIYKTEEEAPYVRDLSLVPAHYIDDDLLLGEAYQMLTAKPVHMLFVRDPGTQHVLGLLTSADVFEIIHNARFTDETDLDNQKPMQMLLKSCWTDKGKELRASGRRSRGPPLSGLPASGLPNSGLPNSGGSNPAPRTTRNTGLPPPASPRLPASARAIPVATRSLAKGSSNAELPPSGRSDTSRTSKQSKQSKQSLQPQDTAALMDSVNRNSYGANV
eukprot:GILI01014891.1.p1 GENE.GILI01014891.1~~GILI01014891.1.p1  ORF type:complete len:452 (+),score=67.04 GILI01014891.1:148-1356(+)